MSDSIDIINAFALLTNFVILPALSYGSQLALGALAVTLVYSVLRFSNFAQGDSMAFGTMIVILLTGFMIRLSLMIKMERLNLLWQNLMSLSMKQLFVFI